MRALAAVVPFRDVFEFPGQWPVRVSWIQHSAPLTPLSAASLRTWAQANTLQFGTSRRHLFREHWVRQGKQFW